MDNLNPNQNFTPKFGTAFSQNLTFQGSPGLWVITSGTLPPGLSLNANNGLVSGTPTLTGNFLANIDASRLIQVARGDFFDDSDWQPRKVFAVLDSAKRAFAWIKKGRDSNFSATQSLSNVQQIVATDTQIFALTNSGKIVILAETESLNSQDFNLNQIPFYSNVISLSTGKVRAYALKSDGKVISWGHFPAFSIVAAGQSGPFPGYTGPIYSSSTEQPPQHQSRNLKKIAVAERSTIGLLANGAVIDFLWNGTSTQHNVPTSNEFYPYHGVPFSIADDPQRSSPPLKCVDICAGSSAYAALLENGSVVCWRDLVSFDFPPSFGYGTNEVIPPVAAQTDVTAIAATQNNHFAALKNNGSVVFWATNEQLENYQPGHTGPSFASGSTSYTAAVAISADANYFYIHLSNGNTLIHEPGHSPLNIATDNAWRDGLLIPKLPGVPVIFGVTQGTPLINANQVFFGAVGREISLGAETAISLTDSDHRRVTSFSAASLPSGLTLNSGRITGIPQDSGNFSVAITATGPGGSDTKNISLQIAVGVPIIAPNQIFTVKYGQSLSATPALVDAADRPASVWEIQSPNGVLAGFSIESSTGLITGPGATRGSLVLNVRASNTAGSSLWVPVTISVTAGTPSLTSSQEFFAKANSAFSSPVTIEDSANRPVSSYSATGLPPGLSINATTGVISGTTGAAIPFGKGISITATGPGGTDTTTAMVFVMAPPVIAEPELSPLALQPFSYTFEIENPSVAGAVLWSATSLPAGLTFSSSGELTGTPSRFGPQNFLVTATGIGGLSSLSIEFNVQPAQPRVFDAEYRINQGVARTIRLAAEQTEAAPVSSWALAEGPRPDWFSFSQTGIISISSTGSDPFANQTLSITAIGPGGNRLITVKLLTVIQPPTVVTPPVLSSRFPTAISFQLSAECLSPFQWRIQNLPKWAKATASGLITGVPEKIGTYNFVATAFNDGGNDSKELIFTILPAAPTLNSSSFSLIKDRRFRSILYVNDPENAPATAFTAVGLPQGLSISAAGIIEGSPSRTGTSVARIRVTGPGGATETAFNFSVVEKVKIYTSQDALVPTEARVVETFESGLVRVTQKYHGLEKNNASDRLLLKVGSQLPGGNIYPAIESLDIFHDPSETSHMGISTYTVTAYGRTNTTGILTTTLLPATLAVTLTLIDKTDPENVTEFFPSFSLDVLVQGFVKKYCLPSNQIPSSQSLPSKIFYQGAELTALKISDFYPTQGFLPETNSIVPVSTNANMTSINISTFGTINEIVEVYSTTTILFNGGTWIKN